MDNIKPLDENGVALLWTQILLNFVKKEEGKGLSTNDLTDELLQKIQSAGTSNFDGDYNSLVDQPQINGIALTGNKTLEELGITKAITDAIGNVTQISFEVVESFIDLPVVGEVGVFYLTPNNGDENNNYDEWIWNEKNSMYELIGSIQNKIDLSEYVKRADVKPIIDNNTYLFTESGQRENIAPSDPIKVILGKIMKWFSDLSEGAASSLLGQNLTANKALISDANGKVAASDVDASKVGFLSGVTSDVQEQINSLNSAIIENLKNDTIHFKKVSTNAEIDDPTSIFDNSYIPYGMIVINYSGTISGMAGGVSFILGYTYPNNTYGAQIKIDFTGGCAYRNRRDGTWSSWATLR